MASALSAWLFDLLLSFAPVQASRYRYRRVVGKKLNLVSPRDFNEKLQWLKLYWQHPLVIECADKYTVRAYVASCGCPEILNSLHGVYEHPGEIDWDGLPEKFVLKCTHGSGFNVICNDKRNLDKRRTLQRLAKWQKSRYGRYSAELHYSWLKPRILCERYIETADGNVPADYKIHCFNGEPRFTLVCSERQRRLKLDYFDLDWQELDFGKAAFYSEIPPARPSCYPAMLEYARRLCRPFPFVRLDFYDDCGAPVLGEMTFTPDACMANCYTEAGLGRIGDMIELPAPYPYRYRYPEKTGGG